MKPQDAAYEGFTFQLGTNTFFIGLFFYPDQVKYPGIVQPHLLIKNGTEWDVVHKTDVIWKDVQEDIYPDPEKLAVSVIRVFNEKLEQYTTGGELTYAQKLALIFQFRLALSNETLIIKPV